MGKVNVLDEEGKIIARVEYNSNLGKGNGNTDGYDDGITKLKDGRYVFIIGKKFNGDTVHAKIITDDEAIQEIIKREKFELLEDPRFRDLKIMYEKLNSMEEEIKMSEKVNVLDEEGKIIARVKYNSNLGKGNGNTDGYDDGITKLKDGRYVFIIGKKFNGDTVHAKIITDDEAIQEIIKREKFELLEDPRFQHLKVLYEKIDNMEEEIKE